VKNLSDGRVEVVAEGRKESIEKLCKAVEHHFGGYIRSKEFEWVEPQGHFKDFQVTF
jgi:acylphosphatase